MSIILFPHSLLTTSGAANFEALKIYEDIDPTTRPSPSSWTYFCAPKDLFHTMSTSKKEID